MRGTGQFDWGYIATLTFFVVHTVQCPMQVAKTYKSSPRAVAAQGAQSSRNLLRQISAGVLSVSSSNSNPFADLDNQPVVEQITLDSVLETKQGKSAFMIYLASEWSMENMIFYDRVSRFAAYYDSLSQEGRLAQAKEIFSTFVQENSMLQVNLSHKVRNDIEKNIRVEKIDKDLFKAASVQVRRLMSDDSLPRFIRSKMCAEWLAGRATP